MQKLAPHTILSKHLRLFGLLIINCTTYSDPPRCRSIEMIGNSDFGQYSDFTVIPSGMLATMDNCCKNAYLSPATESQSVGFDHIGEVTACNIIARNAYALWRLFISSRDGACVFWLPRSRRNSGEEPRASVLSTGHASRFTPCGFWGK